MKKYTLQASGVFFALAFLLSCSISIQENHFWIIVTSLVLGFTILGIDIILNKRFGK